MIRLNRPGCNRPTRHCPTGLQCCADPKHDAHSAQNAMTPTFIRPASLLGLILFAVCQSAAALPKAAENENAPVTFATEAPRPKPLSQAKKATSGKSATSAKATPHGATRKPRARK
nr:hypothetical protein [uncultured Propionivibrio sp.]